MNLLFSGINIFCFDIINFILSGFLYLVPILMMAYFMTLAIFSMCCFFVSKSTMLKFYNYYNFIYRFVMIILRCVFIHIIISSNILDAPQQLIYCINYLLMDILFVEHSNLITFYLRNQQFTMRRIIYVLCCVSLMIQSFCIDGENQIVSSDKNKLIISSLPLIFFFVNYVCDLVRDIVYVLYGNYSVVYITNTIVKPFYLTLSLIIAMPFLNHSYEVIIPAIIIVNCIYDAKSRIRTIIHQLEQL